MKGKIIEKWLGSGILKAYLSTIEFELTTISRRGAGATFFRKYLAEAQRRGGDLFSRNFSQRRRGAKKIRML